MEKKIKKFENIAVDRENSFQNSEEISLDFFISWKI